MNGNNAQSFDPGTHTIATVTHTSGNTVTLANPLTVTGSITNAAGVFTVGANAVTVEGDLTNTGATAIFNAGSSTLAITGNVTNEDSANFNGQTSYLTVGKGFANSATFTAGTGTVELNTGSTSVVAGTTTFYGFVVKTAGKTVNFGASDTTITDWLSLEGTSGSHLILTGTNWFITPPVNPSMRNVRYVDVDHSYNTDATNPIYARSSTDNLNNTNWRFNSMLWVATSSGNWSTPTNWNPNGVPIAGENIVFNGSSVQDSSIENTVFAGSIGSLSIEATYTGNITQNRSLDVTNFITMGAGSGNYTIAVGNGLSAGSVRINGKIFNANGTMTVTNDALFTAGTINANASLDRKSVV